MKIYTKTGDKGETGLVGGLRVSKSDVRLETYGEIDELNSFLGALVAALKDSKASEEIESVEKVQHALFALGSNLASEVSAREKYRLPSLDAGLVGFLESKIDEYDSQLGPLKNFILPNGHGAACAAHVARSVCRRAERKLVHFSLEKPEDMPERAQEFLNRLSDYLFALARFINKLEGVGETVWKS